MHANQNINFAHTQHREGERKESAKKTRRKLITSRNKQKAGSQKKIKTNKRESTDQ